MSWQEVGVSSLRVLLNDLGSTPEYSDSRLTELMVVAARYINQEIPFSTTYTINIIDCSISPEPSETFVNLMILKAACILTRGTQRISAINAFIIHDGTSKIDGRQPALSGKEVTASYCEEYEDAVAQHRLGNAVVGRAIYGPSNISHPHSSSSSNRSRFT